MTRQSNQAGINVRGQQLLTQSMSRYEFASAATPLPDNGQWKFVASDRRMVA